jgi:Rieske Fe-S protein
MNRRNFIQTSGLGTCALLGGIGILSGGCSTLPMVRVKPEANELKVLISQFAEGNNLLVRTADLEFDILLNRESPLVYRAILMQCSHQNQPLTFSSGQIYCPSHGSTFSLEGKVVKAPATNDLKTYTTRISSDNQFVIIQLNS